MDMLSKHTDKFSLRNEISKCSNVEVEKDVIDKSWVPSVLDLKDAFHSLRLSENSKRFHRILSYSSCTSYLYQRMSMGLNISLDIWQSYKNAILGCLQSRKYCGATMDDLLLFTTTKKTDMAKIENMFKVLLKMD